MCRDSCRFLEEEGKEKLKKRKEKELKTAVASQTERKAAALIL